MPPPGLKRDLQVQLSHLEELVLYVEDQGSFGTEEHRYCQTKLQDVLRELRRLERLTDSQKIW